MPFAAGRRPALVVERLRVARGSAPITNGPAGISTKSGERHRQAVPERRPPVRCAVRARPASDAGGDAATIARTRRVRRPPRRRVTGPPIVFRTRSSSRAGTRARTARARACRAGSGPPSRSSSRRSSARGLAAAGVVGIEQVDAPGLEPRLARAREIAERALGVGGNQAAFDVVASQLVAGPAGVVGAVRRLDAQQPLAGADGGPRRRPAPRTAASRRGACRRWRPIAVIAPKNTIHTAMCARLRRPSGPSSPSRCRIGRSPSARHQPIDRRHQPD